MYVYAFCTRSTAWRLKLGIRTVIDALETAVEDGELFIFFFAADFVTFRSVKVIRRCD